MATLPSNDPIRKETILVVEDYDQFRELIRMVLSEDGYHVLEARNGTEALDLFAQFGKNIDMVLTDIIMPGMSGVHLVERIRTLSPRMKVIFMSAYARPQEVQQAIRGERINFIEKSNKLVQLSAKVREVLDERHPIVEWFKKNVSARFVYPPAPAFRTSSTHPTGTP